MQNGSFTSPLLTSFPPSWLNVSFSQAVIVGGGEWAHEPEMTQWWVEPDDPARPVGPMDGAPRAQLRTNWTRRVPRPVPTGHAASLAPH
jgi:hypothetical protein